jgi:hypothetical protein
MQFMLTYGFPSENARGDLIFKLKIKSRKERWISTDAHTLEHTIRTYLKHYIKIGLKS